MKTNKDAVVKISVAGEVAHPLSRTPFRLEINGTPRLFPGTGGITYNFTLGDSAFKMAGDHVEPDVSTKNPNDSMNMAYVKYSCIGNEAIVLTGEAKGAKGYVIGKHGGINHVLVHFNQNVKEKLAIGDKIQVRAWGNGLVLEDYPEVRVYNIDPGLLERVPVEERDGKIYFPVKAIVPGYLMGSGSGSGNPAGGDYDIITNDKNLIKKLELYKLRIGDFVAIENHNDSFGLGGYMEGAITIGVVVHGDCIVTGHGPGVTVIMTTSTGKIKPVVVDESNIGDYLG
ncbi:DUF4438 domain-containing protein [Kosmotoga pacifica]|uniref:DUF4438 domain-containing protein n=1 Tax=Kosmotoga pacifica TaxID=1330330 RepID=A0A0G2ZCT2_9BACT|nr:DUF4438 domain-containing protein [Kosmotoga pacifica]AKI97364.1 hypothetical protein IX53_05510 [Kosmotoga pacifica]